MKFRGVLTSKRQFPIINAKGKLVQFNSFHETNYLNEIKIEIEKLHDVKIVWSEFKSISRQGLPRNDTRNFTLAQNSNFVSAYRKLSTFSFTENCLASQTTFVSIHRRFMLFFQGLIRNNNWWTRRFINWSPGFLKLIEKCPVFRWGEFVWTNGRLLSIDAVRLLFRRTKSMKPEGSCNGFSRISVFVNRRPVVDEFLMNVRVKNDVLRIMQRSQEIKCSALMRY